MRVSRSVLIAMIAISAAVTTVTAPAKVNLGDHIPAEAHMAFWTDNLSDAREKLSANPYLKLINEDDDSGLGSDPGKVMRLMQQIPVSGADPLYGFWSLAFPLAGINLEESIHDANSVFNVNANDLTETFKGSVAIYSTLYDLTNPKNTPVEEWDIVFAMEYDRETELEKVEKFLEKALARVPDSAEKRQLDYSGETVFQIQYFMDEQITLSGDRPSGLDDDLINEIPIIIEYAFLDDVFLLAEGRGEPLRRAVRALRSPDTKFRLSSDSVYQRGSSALDETPGDFHLYYNLTHYLKELKEVPHASIGEYKFFFDMLGSGAALMSNFVADEDGIHVNVALAGESRNPEGIFALLDESPAMLVEDLGLLPIDVESLGVISLDLAYLYENAANLLGPLNRQAAMAMRVLPQLLQSQANVNFESEIVDGSRGPMLSYLRPGSDVAGRNNQATYGVIIPMSGAITTIEAFNRVITAVSSDALKFLDVEGIPFEGVTLWETPDMPNIQGQTLHFSATPRGVVFTTSGAELRDIVRRIMSGNGSGLTQEDRVRRITSQIPSEGLRGLSIIPGAAMIGDFERARIQLRGSRYESLIPDEEALRRSIGDTWWTLHSFDSVIKFRYRIESPN